MATKKPGPYAPLSAHYADDERIMEAGEYAELLYLRMLAYAARTPRTEGWISLPVIQSRLGILPVMTPDGTGIVPGTDPGSRAERLAEVGLIEESGTGYRIASWLRWNRSAAQIDSTRAYDRDRKNAPTSDDAGTPTGSDTGNATGTNPGQARESGGQKQKQKQNQKQDRSIPIPDDWAPTPEHQAKAKELNVDLLREAESFKAHAEAQDRRAVRWNAAFTQWLLKARPSPRGAAPLPVPGGRTLEEWEIRG